MSRVDHKRAKALRAEGKTLREIGDAFGVSRQRIHQIVGPPPQVTKACPQCDEAFIADVRQKFCSHRCARRASYKRRQRPCGDCGKPVGPTTQRCINCAIAHHEATRVARWDTIERLWNDGASPAEIALAIGWAEASISPEIDRMKHAGRHLPPRRKGWKGNYRRSPGRAARPDRDPKQLARDRTAHAVRTNRLIRPDHCERCGAEGYVDGHHHDYSKPLEVEWLCRPCHRTHHDAERAAA